MQTNEPIWVAEARRSYRGGIGQGYSETSFSRGRLANEVLERKLFPSKGEGLDILLVGVGIDRDPIYCSAEPYRISGFLEGKNRDYRMVIVDKDPEVISDVRTRRKVFILNSMYQNHKSCAKEWDSFLKDTNQEGGVINELDNELRLADYTQSELLNSYLKSGFRVAQIPKSFKEKLESNDVILINADIAMIDLSTFDGFDFVSCPNVLYRVEENGQKLAMYNLAKNTRKGGMILINDLGYVGTALLLRQGGWFDEDKQKEIGLVIDEMLSFGDNSQTFVFRKEE